MIAGADRQLDPFPSGWYVLAFSRELRRGGVVSRALAGRELVLFRTAAGRVAALDAHCPHLGAHLGRGGRVEGERLRCPFHGFCFDAEGQCVATGYGSKPPPTATGRAWPVREVNGMVCVFHSADGRPPEWEVPALEQRGWSAPVFRRFALAAHPQETTENSVDLGHFSWVHGYRAVRMEREVVVEGPYLSTAYLAERPVPVVGRWLHFDFRYETHIHGLGYSQVDVAVRGFDIRARLWVLPVPIAAGRLSLTLAASGSAAGDVHPALRPLPPRLRAAAIGRFILFFLAIDARQDFAIWAHKRYVHPPALAHGDGPIGRYRTWARQFYPRVDPAEA
jgi:nitrite reductase/ring-hydroxylating ferredoxin subunit